MAIDGIIIYVLEGVHGLDDGAVMVKDTVFILEGSALDKWNADASSLRDRAGGRDEGEGDGDQSSLAKHDQVREGLGDTRNGSSSPREGGMKERLGKLSRRGPGQLRWREEGRDWEETRN